MGKHKPETRCGERENLGCFRVRLPQSVRYHSK